MPAHEAAIRRKSPTKIDQELWGLLTAYKLMHFEIAQVAAGPDMSGTLITFLAPPREIVEQWRQPPRTVSDGAILRQLADLRARLCHCYPPLHRPERNETGAAKSLIRSI